MSAYRAKAKVVSPAYLLAPRLSNGVETPHTQRITGIHQHADGTEIEADMWVCSGWLEEILKESPTSTDIRVDATSD